jgi:NAD-dependent SIR2 family protein deacetylase
MSKAPALREVPDLPDEIVQAGLNGELVLFVGAGVSALLELPTWRGLASHALNELRQKGFLNYSEVSQLEVLDPKKQLSIARLIAKNNDYNLDLTSPFKDKNEGGSIYKPINDIGCTCVTTNYDELLAPRFLDPKLKESGSVTPLPVNRIVDKGKYLAGFLNEPGTVVHLHGAVSKPETMVITTKDYLEHYDHENVQHFLGELFAKKVVLFIGYGLEEAEILEHILRRSSVEVTRDRRRFALQGYFQSQEPLYGNLHQYYEKSFGVHLIGFVRDHKDYKQQEGIIRAWLPLLEINRPALADEIEHMNEVLGDG